MREIDGVRDDEGGVEDSGLGLEGTREAAVTDVAGAECAGGVGSVADVTDGEDTAGAEKFLSVQKFLRMVIWPEIQSINGLWWNSHEYPNTMEQVESRGVT